MNDTRLRPPVVRHVLGWWPLVVLITMLAVGAGVVGVAMRTPVYTATSELVVTPLAQYDETFLGIGLVRDGGDPGRTTSTLAALLTTQAAADPAIEVRAPDRTNTVEIVATAGSAAEAERRARTFAVAALDQRWRTISAELDARIDALAPTTPADPNAGESSRQLQRLRLVRAGGVDPTLQLTSTSAGTLVPQWPPVLVVALAALGGLLLGVLTATGAARLRWRGDDVAAQRRQPLAAPSAVTP